MFLIPFLVVFKIADKSCFFFNLSAKYRLLPLDCVEAEGGDAGHDGDAGGFYGGMNSSTRWNEFIPGRINSFYSRVSCTGNIRQFAIRPKYSCLIVCILNF